MKRRLLLSGRGRCMRSTDTSHHPGAYASHLAVSFTKHFYRPDEARRSTRRAVSGVERFCIITAQEPLRAPPRSKTPGYDDGPCKGSEPPSLPRLQLTSRKILRICFPSILLASCFARLDMLYSTCVRLGDWMSIDKNCDSAVYGYHERIRYDVKQNFHSPLHRGDVIGAPYKRQQSPHPFFEVSPDPSRVIHVSSRPPQATCVRFSVPHMMLRRRSERELRNRSCGLTDLQLPGAF